MTHNSERERAYVVFQGGGALGVAHFGAWQAIARDFDIVGVAGTSSGSIVAALCAAGLSPTEAFQRFKQGLSEFIDHKRPLCSLFDIIFRTLFGINAYSNGRRFEVWLENQLEDSELKRKDITFEDLYKERNIYLEIIACDLANSANPSVTFSPDERGWYLISRAVRASISLPGFFETIRVGNRVFVDGGLTRNFPIESLYKRANREKCVLIGVRFKKLERSFNWFNIRHVFSKSYEIIMGNSSQVREEIRNYSKCEIIEIDDLGLNPLDFNLSERKISELKHVGEEASREKIVELQKRLNRVKSHLFEQLSPGECEAVAQAQRWFTYEAIPKSEENCKRILNLEEFKSLQFDEDKLQDFYWEIEKYLKRISESLLDQDFDLLKDELSLPSLIKIGIHIEKYNLINPSLSNKNIYLKVLDAVKNDVPGYLSAKKDIKERIDFLKKTINDYFEN
jgi:NTE family protein